MGRYEEKQREQDARLGKKRKGRQFLLLYTNVKRSTAYHGLSRHARSLLFELIDRYTGINNGFIGLGVREAKYELRCSEGTVCSAMLELDDAGLARPTDWQLSRQEGDRVAVDVPTLQQNPRACRISMGAAEALFTVQPGQR